MTRVNWRQWLLWLGALAAVSALMLLMRGRLDKAHFALVYLMVVLGASSAGGRVIGLTVAGGAFLGFNYLFLEPYYTFIITDPLDWLVLVAFLITSFVAAQLLYRAQSTTQNAVARAQEVDRLATLGAETLAAPSAAAALHGIAEVIRTSVNASVVELDRHPASWFGDTVRVAVELPDGTTRLDPASLIGLDVHVIHRRLEVRSQPVGVLRVRFSPSGLLTADSARLLDALAYYAALGVERVRLETSAERAEAERRLESLRSALIMSVSHDLRTPLTTIKALAHEIHQQDASANARIIEEEADRLDALVGDLLDLSRIQAGAVQAVPAVNTVDELIGLALRRARGALSEHPVKVTMPNDLLVATFDITQSCRVLVNLLENAAKYSPAQSTIEIVARRDGRSVMIEVADEGPGIAASDVDRIFEPFYRSAQATPDVRGTGLGLSIARGLAEAQGGTLQYRPRVGGGALFCLTLPAADEPTEPQSL
jgi:two-component system sensor histidine kinase KdpD